MSKSCAACFCTYDGFGNNGKPLFSSSDGCVLENVPHKSTHSTRVCDDCNTQFVIPYRMCHSWWNCRDADGKKKYLKDLGIKINEARFTFIGNILTAAGVFKREE